MRAPSGPKPRRTSLERARPRRRAARRTPARARPPRPSTPGIHTRRATSPACCQRPPGSWRPLRPRASHRARAWARAPRAEPARAPAPSSFLAPLLRQRRRPHRLGEHGQQLLAHGRCVLWARGGQLLHGLAHQGLQALGQREVRPPLRGQGSLPSCPGGSARPEWTPEEDPGLSPAVGAERVLDPLRNPLGPPTRRHYPSHGSVNWRSRRSCKPCAPYRGRCSCPRWGTRHCRAPPRFHRPRQPSGPSP